MSGRVLDRAPIPRLPDWLNRLHAYFDAVRRRPFAWHGHDCGAFAAGAVAAQTGVDLFAPWRGRYRSRAGALRVLRAAGFERLSTAVPLPLIHPSRAAIGDLLALPTDTPFGDVLAVVAGAEALVVTEHGIDIADRMRACRAYRVGALPEAGT